MKIISKATDYYDFVGKVNGEDKNIIYNRTNANVDAFWGNMFFYTDKLTNVILPEYCDFKLHSNVPSFNDKPLILSICGKPFCYYKYPSLSDPFDRKPPVLGRYEQKENSVLVEISKRVKMPVFAINNIVRNSMERNGTKYVIHNEVPLLGNLGLSSIFPPEQLWQDIYYFMANVIRESPDMAKPSNISDKEKIVQHGFDLKQSFRHRK